MTRATEITGPVFVRDYDEWLHADAVWIAYGLCPTNIPIKYRRDRSITIPLPWRNVRVSPTACGFDWRIVPSDDGRFVSRCSVVVDKRLFLPAKQLITDTAELNPPPDLGLFNRLVEQAHGREDLYTNGFVKALYRCDEWYHTNGATVPKAATLQVYDSVILPEYPGTVSEITVTNVSVLGGVAFVAPPIISRTLVADYRYRRARGGHLLPYLQYSLAAGETWKNAGDPALGRRADAAIAGAPNIDAFAGNRFRSLFALTVLLIALAPLIFFFKRSARVSKQTRTK